jgi:hypothetical protein
MALSGGGRDEGSRLHSRRECLTGRTKFTLSRDPLIGERLAQGRKDVSPEPRTEIVVDGTGEFPFDVLGYDSWFPRTDEDAAAMESHRRERRRFRDR